MTEHVADVAVIGAGAIGLLSALELLRRGRQVTVFHDEPARNPASWAGGGILSPLFPWRYSDALTRLTRHAMHDYQALAAELNVDFGVLPQGLLTVTEESEEVLDWCRRHDMQVEQHPDGWFFPALGSVRNPRLLARLREYLQAQGVRFVAERVERVGDASEGLRLDIEAGNDASCFDQVVVATGAWSSQLLAPWGCDLPVSAVKGQMLLWDLGKHCPDTVWLSDAGYFIPRGDGLCLFGSTLEADFDCSLPTRQGYEQLCERARALRPEISGLTPLAIWAGLRPGNIRDVPFIFPVDESRRLWVNTGHFRNGLVAAPASARLMVQWMCGEALEFDPAPYGAP
ncbi:FAD-binding oxidoreductase [Alcanivorax sp. S6407]|uniref:NAD(P)/FAD-dependent oxidoreductase n=1 Tax=Alcanivorax sp. S6407 TaxID=2926424 RepID=UPI001FF1C36C|nr:FAD-dependent oxidoreductase [Alcanivorax sp. S6407]MCK0155215.1 FAD-binding oxidoreductase [Alcanivorax sp. S6407]